ncbi:hypothetical protein EDB85DRAFT_1884846 [Lactarius pseudohatsudake]|nr:hypothetical protein EDB85DRAFT_1884846 [Lactarius pseudohatsudake]
MASTHTDIPLKICGEIRHAKTDVCIVDSDNLLLLIQEDKRRKEKKDPSPQLIAEAVATFQANDRMRKFRSRPCIIPGIILRGTFPTFYKIPVTRQLADSVAHGRYPTEPTVVHAHIPDIPRPASCLSEGMRPLDNRRIILSCYQAFKKFVTYFVTSSLLLPSHWGPALRTADMRGPRSLSGLHHLTSSSTTAACLTARAQRLTPDQHVNGHSAQESCRAPSAARRGCSKSPHVPLRVSGRARRKTYRRFGFHDLETWTMCCGSAARPQWSSSTTTSLRGCARAGTQWIVLWCTSPDRMGGGKRALDMRRGCEVGDCIFCGVQQEHELRAVLNEVLHVWLGGEAAEKLVQVNNPVCQKRTVGAAVVEESVLDCHSHEMLKRRNHVACDGEREIEIVNAVAVDDHMQVPDVRRVVDDGSLESLDALLVHIDQEGAIGLHALQPLLGGRKTVIFRVALILYYFSDAIITAG